MKIFHGFLIMIVLCFPSFQYCAGEEIGDISNKDTTKLNFFNKAIDLQRRITPIDKMIDLAPGLFPQLADPSIIHFNIQNQPLPEENLMPVKAIGDRKASINDKISSRLMTSDTLINGLFQHIALDKKIYKQGEIATLNVTTVLPIIKPEIRFLYKTYKLYPAGKNIYRTVLAVPMDADTGRYFMTLKYEENDIKKSLKVPFRVIPGDFAEQDTAELDIHILTEETLEMMKFEGWKYFAKAYSKSFDTLLCDGNFTWPCAGSITSMYGMARRYNNGLDKWSHKAIDIANAIGTEVVAANNGIVVMAKELEGHGNSVVIAHGQGIHTVYIHLNKIDVAEGDTVVKGQVIGEMGKTGMCTGSNLHFQIMVNRIPTDPRCWIPGADKLKKNDYVRSELAKE
ncbi:MAG: M23 family metallopeptidase [bacterium]